MRAKQFGTKVLRWYVGHQLPVTPVHPTLGEIEGIAAIKSLAELKDPRHTSVSVITPPAVSATIVQQAIALGIPALWFQPGSEPRDALASAEAAGIHVLANGYCILRTADADVPVARARL